MGQKMTSGTCPGCGQEKKNLEVHKRYCKGKLLELTQKTQETFETKDNIVLNTNTPKAKESLFKRIFGKKKLLSTQEIREMRIDTEKLTDEQKFQRFFGQLPKWVCKKPGFMEKYRLGTEIKHCVMVSRDPKKEDVELFIPYNKDLGLLQTDKSFWDMPVKEKGTIYLDADKFIPLINGSDYSKDFDIPEDFAVSLLNRGVDFGQLSQFKSLIDEIRADRLIKLVCIGVAVMAIIFALLVMYGENKAYYALADQVSNLSIVIQTRPAP